MGGRVVPKKFTVAPQSVLQFNGFLIIVFITIAYKNSVCNPLIAPALSEALPGGVSDVYFAVNAGNKPPTNHLTFFRSVPLIGQVEQPVGGRTVIPAH